MQSRLYWHIHKLAFLFEKQADEALKKQVDIGFAQYKVLEAVNQKTLAKQNEVAIMLDQTEASISRQVKILQKKGLIKITDVMGNKRARELTLTGIGDEIVRQSDVILQTIQVEFMSSLSYKEQLVMNEFFERILLSIKNP